MSDQPANSTVQPAISPAHIGCTAGCGPDPHSHANANNPNACGIHNLSREEARTHRACCEYEGTAPPPQFAAAAVPPSPEGRGAGGEVAVAVAVTPSPRVERGPGGEVPSPGGEVPSPGGEVADAIDPWAFVSAHLHNLSVVVTAIRDASAAVEIDQLPSLIRTAADVIEDGIDSAVFATLLPDAELPVVVIPDSPSAVNTLIEDALALRMMYRVMSPAEAAVAMTGSGWTPGRVDRAATLHFAITRAIEDSTDVAHTGASASRVIAEMHTTDADVIRLLVRKGLSEGQIDDYLRAYDWKSDRLTAAWMGSAA